jgi:hypothetical protein
MNHYHQDKGLWGGEPAAQQSFQEKEDAEGPIKDGELG